MFQEYNPNPVGRRVGDCAVRAVAKALDIDWETAYAKIVKNGFLNIYITDVSFLQHQMHSK